MTPNRGLGLALAAAGLLALLLGGWAGAQLRRTLERGPQFRAPFGLAVAEDGAIVVGVESSRIHVYRPDGRLRRAWPVDSGDGPFRLRMAGAERVEVALARTAEVLEFDLLGTLISTRPEPRAYDGFGGAQDSRAEGPAGASYALEEVGLVRVAPPPKEVLVPGPTWPLSLFGGRILPVAVLLISGAVGIIAGIVLTAERRAEP